MSIGKNFSRPTIITSTTIGSYPAADTLTGTVDTDGAVATIITGTGTKFSDAPLAGHTYTENIQVGDYLFDPASGEIRRIVEVRENGQRLDIESAFTSPLSGSALDVIRGRIPDRKITLATSGAGAVTVYESFGRSFSLGQGKQITFGAEDMPYDPIGYDATGTTLTITNAEIAKVN